MVKQKLLIFLSILLLPLVVTADWSDRSLISQLDVSKISQGDVVNLSVLANFQTTTRGPDFSVLKDDFEILSRQASSQLRVINGQPTGTTLWEVALMPKRTGLIDIPSFSVENINSEPLSIEVIETVAQDNDYPITFMTAEVSTDTPYVQQEVRFTLRLYYLGSLRRGSVDMPAFNDFLSERLVNQNQFETLVDDRLYRVIEWVYALYPQKSGQLNIAAKRFEGALLRQRQIEVFQASSDPLVLDVKPIPATFPQDASWLPARQVQLKQEWEITGAFNIGDTLNRRFILEAVGVQASQLPELDFQSNANFRVYADPVGQNQHTSQQGVTSSKQQNFTAVFQQPGEHTFETIEIPWWNTQTDQLEMARLAARKVTVLPGKQQEDPLPTFIPETSNDTNTSQYYWPILTSLFGLAWLITLALWYRQSGMKKPQQLSQDLKQSSLALSALPNMNQFKQLDLKSQCLWLKKWWQYQGYPFATMPHKAPELYAALQAIEALEYSQEDPNRQQPPAQLTKGLYLQLQHWFEQHPKQGENAAKQLALLYPNLHQLGK